MPAQEELFLERADVGNEGFHLIVVEFVGERLHALFTILILHPFLDLLEHLLIREGRLIRCISQVFDFRFFAGFGIAFTVFPMTRRAIFCPIFLNVRRVH